MMEIVVAGARSTASTMANLGAHSQEVPTIKNTFCRLVRLALATTKAPQSRPQATLVHRALERPLLTQVEIVHAQRRKSATRMADLGARGRVGKVLHGSFLLLVHLANVRLKPQLATALPDTASLTEVEIVNAEAHKTATRVANVGAHGQEGHPALLTFSRLLVHPALARTGKPQEPPQARRVTRAPNPVLPIVEGIVVAAAEKYVTWVHKLGARMQGIPLVPRISYLLVHLAHVNRRAFHVRPRLNHGNIGVWSVDTVLKMLGPCTTYGSNVSYGK